MMNDRIRIDVDDHKYTIVQPETGNSYALRYGEPWLDLTNTPGVNMILAMAYEIEYLREQLQIIKSVDSGTSIA